MTLFAAAAGLLSLVIAWLATLRLFSLARRNRSAPERLLAIGFCGLFCVGYPLAAASRAPGMTGTIEGSLFFACGAIGMVTGTIALGRFPLVVFRPGSRWATALSLAIALAGTTAGVGCSVTVARSATAAEMIDGIHGWALLLMSTLAACFLWHAIESSLYFGRMKKRLALGLALPDTTYRFLLWALASWCSFAMVTTIAVQRGSGVAILSTLPMLIIALGSLFTTLCWWLAFFMPRALEIRLFGASAEAHEEPRSAARSR
jgi:hypothetical protein